MRGGTRTDNAVLAFSLLAAAYYAFLALDYLVFRLEWTALDVLRELLTIPLVLAVAVVFALSVLRLLANRRSINARKVGAALLLGALNCLIWGL